MPSCSKIRGALLPSHALQQRFASKALAIIVAPRLFFGHRLQVAVDLYFNLKIMSRLGAVMKVSDLKSLPLDELWDLHEEIVETLAAKLTAEKSVLEGRLARITLSLATQIRALTD